MVRFYEPLGQARFWALPGALSLAAALMVASCDTRSCA